MPRPLQGPCQASILALPSSARQAPGREQGMERGLAEAAAILGVSVDTVRRRVRQGKLPARHDAEGRLLVEVPSSARQDALHSARQESEPAWQVPGNGHADARQVLGGESKSADSADLAALPDTAQLAADLAHAQALIGELRHQRDQLEGEVAALHERLREAHLLAAQRPALAAAAEAGELFTESVNNPRPWWRRWWPWGRET
jgi:excisionase family DNA binding protein